MSDQPYAFILEFPSVSLCQDWSQVVDFLPPYVFVVVMFNFLFKFPHFIVTAGCCIVQNHFEGKTVFQVGYCQAVFA
jgi:hypothetical protein